MGSGVWPARHTVPGMPHMCQSCRRSLCAITAMFRVCLLCPSASTDLSYCLSKCETHIFYVCQLQEIKYCWSRRSTKARHTASDGGQHFTLIKQQRSVLVHWYACTLSCMQKLVVFRLPKKHTWSNTSSEIACSLLWDTWICWHSDSAHQPD